jgi:4-amino-4-deoxy-L-arabinose transferase-like glycosyltransferase
MKRYAGLAVILVAGTGLRFALLGRNSLWFDEAFVAYAIQKGWHDLLAFLSAHDNHPPLYYLLVKVWAGVAGRSEVALRTPSAVFGIASIPLSYVIMQRLSGTVPALITASLVAVSPFEVMAGQDARMYTLLQALTLTATLLLILPDRPRWWRPVYVGLLAAIIYTHYLGFLVIGAHGVWTAWRDRRRLVEWLMDVAVAGVLFVPWMPFFFDQITRHHGWGWAPHPLLDVGGLFAFGGSLFGLGSFLIPGSPLSAAQVAAVLPFVVLAILGARGMALPALVLAVPIGTMALLPLVTRASIYPRWYSFVFPFYAMLVTNGALRIAPRQVIAAVLVAAVTACGLPILGRYYLDPSFRLWNYRGAAAYVKARFRPEDLIVFIGDEYSPIPFDYYYGATDGALTLTPAEASHRRSSFFSHQVTEIAGQHPRVWVISLISWRGPMTKRLIPLLRTSYQEVSALTFSGVDVYLFEVARGVRGAVVR